MVEDADMIISAYRNDSPNRQINDEPQKQGEVGMVGRCCQPFPYSAFDAI